jgi:hypothetical protein
VVDVVKGNALNESERTVWSIVVFEQAWVASVKFQESKPQGPMLRIEGFEFPTPLRQTKGTG